jgi:hypothetical protein
VRGDRGHAHPVAHRQRDHVGQVVLLLRVVVRQPAEPVLQPRGRGHQDAGVDLAQRAFGGVRVLLLDDPANRAARVAHDAPIAGRVGEFDRQQADPRPRAVDQSREGFGPHQRHVAVQNQRRPVVLEQRRRLLHRMSGTELRLLQNQLQVAAVRYSRAHPIGPVADHRDYVGRGAARLRDRSRGGDHVRQHRPSGDRMQHLRQVGAHALALAGGQDHDVHRACRERDGGHESRANPS